MSTEEERKKITEQATASASKSENIIEQARSSRALEKPRRDVQPISDNRVIEEILGRLAAAERRIADLESAVQEFSRSL
jgi:hypothetical protein